MTTPEAAGPARQGPAKKWAGAALFMPAIAAIALGVLFSYSLAAEYAILTSDVTTAVANFGPIIGVICVGVVPFTWFGLQVGWPDSVRGRFLRVFVGSIAAVAVLIAAAAALGGLARQ